MDRGPVNRTVTPEQWKMVESDLAKIDIDDMMRYSSGKILRSLDLPVYKNELLIGQRFNIPGTNVSTFNRGLELTTERGQWEGETLIIYYSMEESLNSMTVVEIKQALSDIGTDTQSHRTKQDYIEQYLDSVTEDYDMSEYLDTEITFRIV